jgi:hypothetical protein
VPELVSASAATTSFGVGPRFEATRCNQTTKSRHSFLLFVKRLKISEVRRNFQCNNQ